jgi:hypothetical protein
MTVAPEALPLTVAQLMERLKACAPDTPVVDAAGDPLVLVLATEGQVALVAASDPPHAVGSSAQPSRRSR